MLNAHARGGTLAEARAKDRTRPRRRAQRIDELGAGLVDAGLAFWGGAGRPSAAHRSRTGQSDGASNEALDLERIRLLFADLETQTDVIDLLHRAEDGEGVKIFIGSENKLFRCSGSSMIAAPLRGSDRRIAGVLGVIGPTRLNYGRIVPMVEYAAQCSAIQARTLTSERRAATNGRDGGGASYERGHYFTPA